MISNGSSVIIEQRAEARCETIVVSICTVNIKVFKIMPHSAHELLVKH